MKKILAALLALASSVAFSATTVPVQLLNPTGSSSGQAIVSTGASSAPAWGGIGLNGIAAIAANTVLANATGSSAAPTAFAMPSCSTSASALNWTTSTGFTCNTAVNAAQLGGATFAAPGAIGGTTPGAGSFTTLGASGNDALFYQTTNALSVPNITATTVTTWTKISDRVNANFNASTGVFTAPVTGQYLVSAGLTFASGMTGGSTIAANVRIVANGVTIAGNAVQVPATTTTAISTNATALASLTAGQTIVVQAFQNSGGAVSLAVGSAYNNYISIVRVP